MPSMWYLPDTSQVLAPVGVAMSNPPTAKSTRQASAPANSTGRQRAQYMQAFCNLKLILKQLTKPA